MSISFPKIVGIVNMTPDSFSDGGAFASVEAATEYALKLAKQGADILDIGGESTRPGATALSIDEEIERVEPLIRKIRESSKDVPISIDTRKSEVAAHALEAGADIINDVSAGLFDTDMLALAAKRNVPLVLMHMLGEPSTMQQQPVYANVVADVFSFLRERISAAREAGIQQIIADVGIGFGKTLEHNLDLLRQHRDFLALGVPLMLGLSRKRLLGAITGIENAAERDVATALTHALLLDSGASYVRVHNVQYICQLKKIFTALESPNR
jgi:dihydropteroate synthase